MILLTAGFRDRDVEGPLQKDITFIKGRRYVFYADVRLLNEVSGKLWQSFKAVVQMNLADQGW